MKKNNTLLKSLDDFDNTQVKIVDISFTFGGALDCGGPGGDADRICSSLCPTNGCAHDGCCGDNWDAGGEPGVNLGLDLSA